MKILPYSVVGTLAFDQVAISVSGSKDVISMRTTVSIFLHICVAFCVFILSGIIFIKLWLLSGCKYDLNKQKKYCARFNEIMTYKNFQGRKTHCSSTADIWGLFMPL